MDPSAKEQILRLIEKSNNFLLLTHARADADGLGAMLSMYAVLKKLGKNVTAVTSDPAPEDLKFLPSIDIVQNSLASSSDFVITLNTSGAAINKIKYNVEDNKVNIIISPKSGEFTPADVSFGGATAKFDLIMTFDTGNLEHLGKIYEQNTEMFFNIPVVNVDHHASNTDFGQVNLVDVTAASATEVTFGLIKDAEKYFKTPLIDEDMATLLLAGVITDTGSFQHSNTSPRAMEVAAELLDLGARQQEIIKNIYKTKKLSTLKLWGIVLSKVQVDPIHRMVWSAISRDDLQEAGAVSEETGTIIDDLLSNAPGAEVIFLIKENPENNYVSVSLRSTSNAVDVGKLSTEMGGGGHVRAAGFKITDGRPFDQAVNEIISKIRDFQAKRLGIGQLAASPESTPPATVTTIPAEPAPKPAVEVKTAEKPTEAPKETVLEFKAPAENATLETPSAEKPKTTSAKSKKPPTKDIPEVLKPE